MSYFKTRIVIIEGNDLLRESYALLLDSVRSYHVVNAYSCCQEALRNLVKDNPDLILMDLLLPAMDGIACTLAVKKLLPKTEVLINSEDDRHENVFGALCAGASGYITKGSNYADLLQAVEQLLEGGAPLSKQIARLVVSSFQRNPHSPLSNRETEVLQLISEGKSYRIIAEELFITKETAKSHIKNIYSKLQVNNKAEALLKARQEKLI